MRPIFSAIPISSGAIQLNSGTPSATAFRLNGWARDSTGKGYATSAGSAVPAGAIKYQGLAFTALGALYVTDSAVASTATSHQGFSIRADGALHVNSASVPATGVTNFNGLSVVSGRLYESGV